MLPIDASFWAVAGLAAAMFLVMAVAAYLVLSR